MCQGLRMKGDCLEEWVNKHSKAVSAAKTVYSTTGCVILFRGPVANHSKSFPSTSACPDLSTKQVLHCVFYAILSTPKEQSFLSFLDDPQALFVYASIRVSCVINSLMRRH